MNLQVRIELSAGDTRRYRLTSDGLVADKTVPVAPANYGEILGHTGPDGDLLDALVFSPQPLTVGETVHATPVGVLLRRDDDHKVVCVTAGHRLPDDHLDTLGTFFAGLSSSFRPGGPDDLQRILHDARIRPSTPPLTLHETQPGEHLSHDGSVRYLATATLARHHEEHAPHPALRSLAELPYVQTPILAFPDVEDEPYLPSGVAVTSDAPYLLPFAVGKSACGFRVLRTGLRRQDLTPARLARLASVLSAAIAPDSRARQALVDQLDLPALLHGGLPALVQQGLAAPADLDRTEQRGQVQGASSDLPDLARPAARTLGSSGAWGHYLEISAVHQLHRPTLGLEDDQVLLLIHMGGRFLWPELRALMTPSLVRAALQHGWATPAQVARGHFGVRTDHPVGAAFLAQLRATLNYAYATRGVMAHLLTQALQQAFGVDASLLSDNAHVALDEVQQGGVSRYLHRNGQHRLAPAGHPDTPAAFAAHGQPVLLLGAPGIPSVLFEPHPDLSTPALMAHGIASGPAGPAPARYPAFTDVLHNTRFQLDPGQARANLALAAELAVQAVPAATLRPLANLRASALRS